VLSSEETLGWKEGRKECVRWCFIFLHNATFSESSYKWRITREPRVVQLQKVCKPGDILHIEEERGRHSSSSFTKRLLIKVQRTFPTFGPSSGIEWPKHCIFTNKCFSVRVSPVFFTIHLHYSDEPVPLHRCTKGLFFVNISHIYKWPAAPVWFAWFRWLLTRSSTTQNALLKRTLLVSLASSSSRLSFCFLSRRAKICSEGVWLGLRCVVRRWNEGRKKNGTAFKHNRTGNQLVLGDGCLCRKQTKQMIYLFS